MERQLRLLLAGVQDSLRLHSSHLVTSASTTNSSRREPITPPPVEGLQEKPLALIVNAYLSRSNFRGLLLRNVNAVYCSMCRKMAFLNICFHLKFPKPFFFFFCTRLSVTMLPCTYWVAGWEVAISSPNKANPKILLMKICSCSWDLATACKSW